MEVSAGRETLALPIEDTSHVSAARRQGGGVARRLDFDEEAVGRVALSVTEAATNILKHAGRGEILLTPSRAGDRDVVEILALDRGPGMANVERCFEDGFSTAGSAGTGLGAMRRLSCGLDVYSRPGGTALLMRIGSSGCRTDAGPTMGIGGLSVAVGGEARCGDAWDHERGAGILTVLVVDGLGHGAGAADAARESVLAFRRGTGAAPADRVAGLHEALRGTRGAALAVAEIDFRRRMVRFAGIGNIVASVYGEGPVRHLVSHHGIAGHNARRIGDYTYPWPGRGLLVMHSDGVATLRQLDLYPGLLERDPSVIAGVLYRDFSRRRDDATVVVARGAQP